MERTVQGGISESQPDGEEHGKQYLDENGAVQEEKKFDQNRNYSSIQYKLNKENMVLSKGYYGKDEDGEGYHLVLNEDGFAKTRYKYNRKNMLHVKYILTRNLIVARIKADMRR